MNQTKVSPEFDYIRLRAALELFGKSPAQLSETERDRAESQALREYQIESRILSAPEALGIVIADEEVRRAVTEVRKRFADESSFLDTLAYNRLDAEGLEQGLARQCRVNTVLDRVDTAVPAQPVSAVEVGIYYHSHFETFQQPERREAYHILISINDDFPENSRVRARERLMALRDRLMEKPKQFEALALKYSECPTAMRGGRIGWIRRGQLYPQLDAALFRLKSGGLSLLEESDMGFHLLWCKAIRHPETLSLEKASPHIRKILRERLKEQHRRTWIASLEPAFEGDTRT